MRVMDRKIVFDETGGYEDSWFRGLRDEKRSVGYLRATSASGKDLNNRQILKSKT